MWNSSPCGTAPADLTSSGYVLNRSAARLGRLEPLPLAERQDAAALNRRLVRDRYLYLTDCLDPAIVLSFRQYYFAELAETGLVKPGTAPVEGVAAEERCRVNREHPNGWCRWLRRNRKGTVWDVDLGGQKRADGHWT